MSGFWDRRNIKPQEAAYQEALQAQPIQLDEEAMAVLQEDPNVDIFEEEEDDTQIVMSDANLRLEQGRLYQMVLQNDIFADTNADPRAIRNVQREIRRFVRERMETMLGIRQEQAALQPIISSPFNDTEVTVLKMLASRMSKGESEKTNSPAPIMPVIPKKDGINSISGNLRPQTSTPLKANPKPIPKSAPKEQKKPIAQAAPKVLEPTLTKPIEEMTPEELVQHDKAALERRAKLKSALPTNLVPHPTPQQLEMLYTSAAANAVISNPWRSNGG